MLSNFSVCLITDKMCKSLNIRWSQEMPGYIRKKTAMWFPVYTSGLDYLKSHE